MVPLKERCELLSDAWLAEAQAFLMRTWETRKDRLGDLTFLLCEQFADAPPHLGCDGNVAQWSVRLSSAGVEVSREQPAHPDLQVIGDYQATLALAQVVGASAPGVMENAHREAVNMFGQRAPQVKGASPPPVIAEIFALLHDHMARRTVENPDLIHRAARQGLTRKLAEYQETGYTVLERAITPQLADELRDTLLREVLTHDLLQSHGLLCRGQIFELMVQHPLLRTVVEAALGRGAIIASLAGIHKVTGKSVVPLHTDYTLIPDPYPDFGMSGVAVWALEDWTLESGPTWIIPGSQNRRRFPTASDVAQDGVPVLMPKGSVEFFGNGVWHWQGDRTAPGARVTLHAQYVRGFIRPLDPLNIEPHMLHRNSPAFAELTGQDDPFEKSGVLGHDMERWAHMEKLLRRAKKPV